MCLKHFPQLERSAGEERCVTILKTAARETRNIQATQSLQLVHSDVCSPMRMHTLYWRSEVFKVKYYVMFVDDYTWCCTACLLHERQYKSIVFDKFKEFKANVCIDVCTR